MKHKRWIPAVAALSLLGYAFAQTQTTSGGSDRASGSVVNGGPTKASQTAPPKGQASGNGLVEGASIARPTHVIVYSTNPTGSLSTASAAIWADQAVYWKRQEERGKLLYAGPMTPDGALMVLKCANNFEAQDIADQDPVVKANLFLAHARPWSVSMIGRGVIQMDRESK